MNLKQMIFNTMNFNSMKRIVLALMLISVSMVSVQAQLLYKISKDSTDQKPSYIMASNRLMNPMGVVSLSGELKEALTNTDQMYFEVNKAAYQETINDAKKLADGKTLLSLLTPAQQTKLNAFLKKYMEVDFRSSYVQKKYGNLTPAALMEDMEQLLFVANHMGMYDPTHTFDQYFEAQAKANNEYYLLRKTACPIVIAECGFLSSPEEEGMLSTPEYQEKVADVLCQSIKQYLSERSIR